MSERFFGIIDSVEQEEIARQEKEKRLEEIRAELEKITDAEGKSIDEGIKETVLFMNVLEIPTIQSCEGHLDEKEGNPFPWVEIGAEDEPEERWIGQNAAFENAAKERDVSVEELKHGTPENLYWEVMREISKNTETPEYQAWAQKNEELRKRASDLLEKFYQKRDADSDIKLEVDESEGRPFGLHSHDDKFWELKRGELPSGEREKMNEKFMQRRREMRAFTEFLKDKYLSGG